MKCPQRTHAHYKQRYDWHDLFRKNWNGKRLDMSDKLGADGCNATIRSRLTCGEHKEGGSFYNH